MRYIDYKAMKDFYIIAEVCELFEVNMQKLRQYSEQYDVQPQQDQMGRWGFSKVHVRKLHNTCLLYTSTVSATVASTPPPPAQEHRSQPSSGGPWLSKSSNCQIIYSLA